MASLPKISRLLTEVAKYCSFPERYCPLVLKSVALSLRNSAFFLGWHVGMDVPPNIYWIYVTEAGFYIHGIYGTICMDVWRDDSVMLILHHILTISLVVFSLGLR